MVPHPMERAPGSGCSTPSRARWPRSRSDPCPGSSGSTTSTTPTAQPAKRWPTLRAAWRVDPSSCSWPGGARTSRPARGPRSRISPACPRPRASRSDASIATRSVRSSGPCDRRRRPTMPSSMPSRPIPRGCRSTSSRPSPAANHRGARRRAGSRPPSRADRVGQRDGGAGPLRRGGHRSLLRPGDRSPGERPIRGGDGRRDRGAHAPRHRARGPRPRSAPPSAMTSRTAGCAMSPTRRRASPAAGSSTGARPRRSGRTSRRSIATIARGSRSSPATSARRAGRPRRPRRSSRRPTGPRPSSPIARRSATSRLRSRWAIRGGRGARADRRASIAPRRVPGGDRVAGDRRRARRAVRAAGDRDRARPGPSAARATSSRPPAISGPRWRRPT